MSAAPYWCETDGCYHPRNWPACGARAENRHQDQPPAIDLDKLASLVADEMARRLAPKPIRFEDVSPEDW